MPHASSIFAILGTAAVATVIGQPMAQRSWEAIASGDAVHTGRAVKSDRLAPASVVGERRVPISVEIVSGRPMNLTLKGQDGAIIFSVDGSVGTTSIAKDGDIPAITLRAGEAGPPTATRAPVPTTAQEAPAAAPAKPAGRINRVGCEGSVSNLVSPEARRMLPSRCLV